MDSQRLTRVVQLVAAVGTVAAMAFLLPNGHIGPAVGVGVAGAVLVAGLAVIDRKVVPARQGTLSPAEREHNLAVVRTMWRGLLAVGLAAVVVGAVLTVTGIGDDGVAHALLVWVGPHTIAAGLGGYTGYTVMRRELTGDGQSTTTRGDSTPAQREG